MSRRASAKRSVYPFRAFPLLSSPGQKLFIVVAIALLWGVLMVASASQGMSTSPYGYTPNELKWILVGTVAFIATACLRLGRGMWPACVAFMYFALGLLVVVFLFGTNVNGGQRWLYIGSYSLQPAEIFKFATILYLGAMFVKFSERERSTAQWVVSATPIVLGLLLIMAEHDIGTAAVYTAIIFTFLFMAGFPRKKLLTGIGAGAVVFLVALVVFRHTRERIQFWISGFHDAQNHGYQMHQSWIALGSGGPFGHFYGHSIAKWGYLPNPHTDFILSVLGEEFGFIGTLAVLTLFLFFLRYASQIARESRVSVYSAMAYGVIGWIMVETTINVASVIGIFPVTGVPLPFFSYGGTALVMEMAAMGLLFNISGDRSERDHRSLARIQTPSDQRRRRLMRDAAMYGRE